MKSQIPRKKQSFKTPLVNKVPAPLSYAIMGKDDPFNFAEFDQAFMLRKLSKYCYFQTVIAQFLPNRLNPENTYKNQDVQDKCLAKDPRHKKYFAVYNNDRRYYTPAFVIGKDLREYTTIPYYDLEKFKDKLGDAQKRTSDTDIKNKSPILLPKPTSTKCQICKCQFQDYLEHTKSQNHLKLLRQSKGWEFVNEFMQNFKKKTQQQQNQSQNTPIIILKDSRKKKRNNQQIQKAKKQVAKGKQYIKTKLISKKISNKSVKFTQASTKRIKMSGASSTINASREFSIN